MYTLIIWTIVGFTQVHGSQYTRHDWRALSQHGTEKSCVHAAEQLGLKPERYRCVAK